MELRSILNSTKVGELTAPLRKAMKPTDTIGVAAAEMRQQSHGSTLVWADGKLVGIFTERDLLKVLAAGQSLDTPLSEAMTPNPQTVSTQDTLFDATKMMDDGGYRRLPVLDPSGEPVGFVDVKSVSHFLVEHFSSAVHTQAAHAQVIAKEREGA